MLKSLKRIYCLQNKQVILVFGCGSLFFNVLSSMAIILFALLSILCLFFNFFYSIVIDIILFLPFATLQQAYLDNSR